MDSQSKNWLETWLTTPFTWKKLLHILLLAIIIGLLFKLPVFTKPAVTPVILLINSYPLTPEEKHFLARTNPYGFLLGIPVHKNMNVPALKKELQTILKRKDFVFFIDQEGGLVDRIKHFDPSFNAPAPQTYGDLAKKNLSKAIEETYQYGLRTGRFLHDLGIDVVFAPLAEPANPEGKTYSRARYFSEDPQTAKQLADSFADGLADGGVIPCYKHFLGTASTQTDPHSSAQHITRPLDALRLQELVPFANARRWPYILTAHATYEAIDPNNISTYSPAFYRFLRSELDFDGFIITDALNMEAANGSNAKEVGWRMNNALTAGADLVLPFFAINEDPAWMEEQIKLISPSNIKRFQRKLERLKN